MAGTMPSSSAPAVPPATRWVPGRGEALTSLLLLLKAPVLGRGLQMQQEPLMGRRKGSFLSLAESPTPVPRHGGSSSSPWHSEASSGLPVF